MCAEEEEYIELYGLDRGSRRYAVSAVGNLALTASTHGEIDPYEKVAACNEFSTHICRSGNTI